MKAKKQASIYDLSSLIKQVFYKYPRTENQIYNIGISYLYKSIINSFNLKKNVNIFYIKTKNLEDYKVGIMNPEDLTTEVTNGVQFTSN